MDKKLIPILALILLIWFGWFLFLNNKKTNDLSKDDINNTIPDETKKVESIENNNNEEQVNIVEEKDKWYNYYNDAASSMDINLCEKIKYDEDLKQKCFDNVYAWLAWSNNDNSYCNKIKNEDTKNRCLNSFAYDKAISWNWSCDSIVWDDNLKEACKSNIIFEKIESSASVWDLNICDELIWDNKTYCLNRINKNNDITTLDNALKSKNINDCNSIQDVSFKNTCTDTINLQTALSTKNISLCNKLLDTNRKTSCLEALNRDNDRELLQSAINESNTNLCNNIKDNNTKIKCFDTIYLRQGINTKNLSICNKITDIKIKKECTDNVNLIIQK